MENISVKFRAWILWCTWGVREK